MLVKRIFSILNLPSINFIFISLLIFVAFLIEKFLRKTSLIRKKPCTEQAAHGSSSIGDAQKGMLYIHVYILIVLKPLSVPGIVDYKK